MAERRTTTVTEGVTGGQLVEGNDNQVVPARPLCTCCDPAKPLALGENNVPFAMCVAGNKVYERNAGGEYVITDYVYRGAKIMDAATGRTVYPPDSTAPSTDELLRDMRGSGQEETSEEETPGGSKPTTEPRERVNLRGAEYY